MDDKPHKRLGYNPSQDKTIETYEKLQENKLIRGYNKTIIQLNSWGLGLVP